MPKISQIYYSFAYRLLLLHVRSHLLLMLVFLFIGLLMTGMIGRFFGIHYLLLTPEYMGRVDWLSFGLLGASFGALFMVWNLTSYLLCSSRFSFLATLSAPFTKFCINNALIPSAFLVIWLIASIRFQRYEELWSAMIIAQNIVGFLVGLTLFVSILAAWFQLTNKDIGDFLLSEKSVFFKPKFLRTSRKLPGIQDIRTGRFAWRCDTYLNEKLQPRLVRSVAHYDAEILGAVFNQNHFNAVAVQIGAMLFLMTLGLFMDNPRCQIPTGASIFILGSMVIALFGAITFWFEKWGTVAFLTLVLTLDFVSSFGWFKHWNQAYGIDYQQITPVKYDYPNLEKIAAAENITTDSLATISILNQWKNKNQTAEKPKMVFLCASGGGMRAAIWTMQVLQKTDADLGGNLMKKSVLMSGASGGMLGASYFRELTLRQNLGENIHPSDPIFLEKIGLDLLNPVCFAIVSNDLFFPFRRFDWAKHDYRRDRGYMFEQQIWRNTDGFLRKKLSDYRLPEASATIPMSFISPFILNDARRLIISPQNVSYMMRPTANALNINDLEIDAVDFRRLFADRDADDLSFCSALRMNATYPYILPNTHLPTMPEIETMDAGFRDNYGTLSAVRFASFFQKWIRENTSGIVFVEIRCWPKIGGIEPSDRQGWVTALLHPAKISSRLGDMQDFAQDQMIGLLANQFGKTPFERILFTYQPVRKESEATMNLHLSKRERNDLETAFFSTENQASLARLRAVLK
jgi:hypothetical protein